MLHMLEIIFLLPVLYCQLKLMIDRKVPLKEGCFKLILKFFPHDYSKTTEKPSVPPINKSEGKAKIPIKEEEKNGKNSIHFYLLCLLHITFFYKWSVLWHTKAR